MEGYAQFGGFFTSSAANSPQTYYTTDGFKTQPKKLIDDRLMCQWAKASERFLQGIDKHDDRILCITRGKYSDRSKDFRLMVSDE